MDEGDRGNQRRIALTIQYDGTRYAGWQLQENANTVQAEIERSLAVLLKEKVRVVASGRTDTGVHALGQVIHFDIPSGIPLDRLCAGMNGILPGDIAVKNACEVPADFHARFSAREREYLYRIYNHSLRSPFMLYRALWVIKPLDIAYLREASRHFIGVHDFASFCKKSSAAEMNTVREILSFDIGAEGNELSIVIRGNGFLHNMIRIMIGTLLELHKTGEAPGVIRTILERCDRDCSGFTAPAYGLYLRKVSYDPPLASYKPAFPDDYLY